jgi:hypothetical protein
MGRTKKGRESPKVFDELSDSAKRRIRNRQMSNGFRDVKTLVTLVNADRAKQGLPSRSRSYVSEINLYLREANERRKRHAEWLHEIQASPEDFIATALAGIVGQMDQVFDLLMAQASLPPADDTEEMQRRISNQKMLASIWQSLARALKDFKADARIDGVTFAKIVEETMSATAKQASKRMKTAGLSDELNFWGLKKPNE